MHENSFLGRSKWQHLPHPAKTVSLLSHDVSTQHQRRARKDYCLKQASCITSVSVQPLSYIKPTALKTQPVLQTPHSRHHHPCVTLVNMLPCISNSRSRSNYFPLFINLWNHIWGTVSSLGIPVKTDINVAEQVQRKTSKTSNDVWVETEEMGLFTLTWKWLRGGWIFLPSSAM